MVFSINVASYFEEFATCQTHDQPNQETSLYSKNQTNQGVRSWLDFPNNHLLPVDEIKLLRPPAAPVIVIKGLRGCNAANVMLRMHILLASLRPARGGAYGLPDDGSTNQ